MQKNTFYSFTECLKKYMKIYHNNSIVFHKGKQKLVVSGRTIQNTWTNAYFLRTNASFIRTNTYLKMTSIFGRTIQVLGRTLHISGRMLITHQTRSCHLCHLPNPHCLLPVPQTNHKLNKKHEMSLRKMRASVLNRL